MRGACLQQLSHAHPAGDPALPDADDPAERDGRPRQQDQVGVERHQAADRHPPQDHLASPGPQNDERPRAAQHGEERRQRAAGPHQGERAGQVLVVEPAELRLARGLQRVVLDDRDPRQVLLDRRRHHAQLFLDGAAGAVHLAREQPRAAQQCRIGEQREQRQPRRQMHQQPDGRGVDQRRIAEVEEPRPEHRPHRPEVIGQPRHHVAGRMPAIEPRIEAQQMTEEIAAQPVLDVPPGVEDEDARPGTDERLGDGEHGDQRCVADHQGVQPAGRAGASPKRVDRPLDQPGDRQGEGVRGAKAEAAEKDAGHLRPQPHTQPHAQVRTTGRSRRWRHARKYP